VQDNRLEAEVVGWGEGEQSWSIEYRVFPGSPAQPTVWKDLTDWLHRKWLHTCGIALRVECVVVDTGGHHTKEAYWFVRRYRGRCYAIKGSNQQGAPLVPPRPTRPRGSTVHLYHVGTVAAKDTIFERLKIETPGHGYMHFPDQPGYDANYFKQLTNEERRNKYDRGVIVGYYYKKLGRNEVLDIWVYNLVAVALLNPDLERMAKQWDLITARAKTRQIELPDTAESPAGTPALPTVTLGGARPSRRVISRGVS